MCSKSERGVPSEDGDGGRIDKRRGRRGSKREGARRRDGCCLIERGGGGRKRLQYDIVGGVGRAVAEQ